jgi:hypothetical protein
MRIATLARGSAAFESVDHAVKVCLSQWLFAFLRGIAVKTDTTRKHGKNIGILATSFALGRFIFHVRHTIPLSVKHHGSDSLGCSNHAEAWRVC